MCVTVTVDGGGVTVVFIGIESVSGGRSYDIPTYASLTPGREDNVHMYASFLCRPLEKTRVIHFLFGRVTPILVLHVYGDAKYGDMR